mmetsp:Transcript_13033/g.21698  ORF Transcript_13033/g.21698 Transcript_13033/m.21698 type:complete len:107 (+) Transcript_13033:55-375(+)
MSYIIHMLGVAVGYGSIAFIRPLGYGKQFAVFVLVVVLATLWDSPHRFNNPEQPPFLKEWWKKLPDMMTKRGYLGVAVGDGKLFAVGGSRDGIVHFKSGEWLRIAT